MCRDPVLQISRRPAFWVDVNVGDNANLAPTDAGHGGLSIRDLEPDGQAVSPFAHSTPSTRRDQLCKVCLCRQVSGIADVSRNPVLGQDGMVSTAFTRCPGMPTGRVKHERLGALLGHNYKGAFMMLGRGHPRRSRRPTARYWRRPFQHDPQ